MGIQVPEDVRRRRACRRVDYCICIEELARVDPSIALSVAAHNGLCVGAPGDVRQRRRRRQQYLVPLAEGETLGAWGADRSRAPAATRRDAHDGAARRRRAGCSTAPSSSSRTARIGGTLVVMAVTDRAQGSHGISAFVVPRGTPGLARRQEGKQARDARERHERSDPRGLPRAGRGDRRRGGRGLRQHDAGARCRPHRHRGAGGRPGAGRVRGGAALRARAPPVRPADRAVSGDSLEAGRHGDADRGGAAADVPRRLDARPARRAHLHRSRRSRSSTRARSPCAPPRSACRSTAATAS